MKFTNLGHIYRSGLQTESVKRKKAQENFSEKLPEPPEMAKKMANPKAEKLYPGRL